MNAVRHGSSIIPCLRYRDPRAAIDWLSRAFGFVEQSVYRDEGGAVIHAQLTWRGGMIMLGPVRDNDFGKYIVQPDQIDGRETQCACVVVADCKAHYQQAMHAGAILVEDYTEKDYGGAGYACRDLEGHLWWFGSYDPWETEA